MTICWVADHLSIRRRLNSSTSRSCRW